MNDPDPRQTSDGFDHDAMFAEIVAHWNDAATEPAAGTPAGSEATHDGRDAVDRQPEPEIDETATDGYAGADGRAATDGYAADVHPEDRAAASEGPVERQSPGPPPAVPAPQAWRAHEVDDEYEEHFEPPPVAPLPVGDLQFWGILAGMGGGPLLLLYLVLFNRESSSYWMFLAIAMSVGGFALLVARLPRDHSDDGDDNGARL